jgi:hypothetical protein
MATLTHPAPATTHRQIAAQPDPNKNYTQEHTDTLTPWRRQAVPGPSTIDTLGEH